MGTATPATPIPEYESGWYASTIALLLLMRRAAASEQRPRFSAGLAARTGQVRLVRIAEAVDSHSELPVELPMDRLAELICQTRAGESGSSFVIAPNETKALATALAIRPPMGMIAPSPAPLTPSGLLGDRWFSSAIARMLRKSVAVG